MAWGQYVARKGWDQLSPNYRVRLERAGISAKDYTAGISLSKARGHSQTPEHPTDKISKTKYPTYYAKRQQLMRDFVAKKQRLWGALQNEYRRNGRRRYDPTRAVENVRDGKMSNALLEWALSADEGDLIDGLREDPETFAFIGYH